MSKTGRICHRCGKVMKWTEGIESAPPIRAYWHVRCASTYLETAVEQYSKGNISRNEIADVLLAVGPVLGEMYNNLLDRALEEA